jgi:hypothetical protein
MWRWLRWVVAAVAVVAVVAVAGRSRSVTGQLVIGGTTVRSASFRMPMASIPSFTGFVTTQNHGTLEFLLDLSRA